LNNGDVLDCNLADKEQIIKRLLAQISEQLNEPTQIDSVLCETASSKNPHDNVESHMLC
jgi:hypothetical protein